MGDEEATSIFERAAGHLPTLLAKLQLPDETLLYLYARFKQATEGRCATKKPGFFEFQARKKWEAWNSLTDLSQEEAKEQYIEKIKELDPDWQPDEVSPDKSKSTVLKFKCFKQKTILQLAEVNCLQ